MTPQFLYFDLGNVLLNFDRQRAWRQMGEVLRLSPALVSELVVAAQLERRYESGELDDAAVHEIICAEARSRGAGNPNPELARLRTAGSAMFTLNDPVWAIVARLSDAGHPLGILSNTCSAHWEYCRTEFPQLQAYFSVYALSYRIGAMKPDPRCYAAAAKLAGRKPKQIFFVDDRQENVAAAATAGFDAVLFDKPEQLVADLQQRRLLD